MIKKYHVSEQYGNTWNPKSYVKFISGTQTYNKFPITLRTTQQSIPTWSVKGNMVQNGVPSSTAPITPSECGERTANLFDKDNPNIYNGYYNSNTGKISAASTNAFVYIPIEPNTKYYFTGLKRYNANEKILLCTTASEPSNGVNVIRTAYLTQITTSSITTTSEERFIALYICGDADYTGYGSVNVAITTNCTDLIIDNGYVLPIKSGLTTTLVYLGQVQSTRKIKKLVLDGTENVTYNARSDANGRWVVTIPTANGTTTPENVICTHFKTVDTTTKPLTEGGICMRITGVDIVVGGLYTDIGITSPSDSTTIVNAVKAYLAAQYATGTPVTVWYVLANETTGIVNEPLRKIGNYVDSITNPVSLPTVPGINTIDVNTTLKPSEMSLTYDGYKVCKSTKIQQVTREVDFVNNTKSIIGSVDNLKVYQLMNRCNVSDNGTITAYYGDPNYTEDGSNGQVMVYVKKFYYKLDVSQPGDLSGINIRKGRWSISDIPIEGYKLHPAFLAADGVTELPYFLYGAFDAVGQDSNGIYSSSYNTTSYKLSSVGGNTYKPICSLTRATARTMATNRGNGWYQVGVKQTMAIQMLFAVEFGFNSQIGVGRGIVNDTGTHNTGLTIGNKTSGTYDNATTAVNYRGIENLWGNICNFIDGINISNTTPYICDTFTFSDNTSTNHTRISFILPGINYTTAFGYDSNNDWILLPSETNRSTVDEFGPIGDYFGSNSDWRVARLGGSYIYGRDAGLFYWDCHYNSSYTDVGVGARLMYIPQTT